LTAAAYPSPRALLDKYDLRAKKSWGQNFLGDQAVLDDIARLAAPWPGLRVVELGAGLGHLTARLLARGAAVTAVERDRDMARVLRGELGDRITLLEADAARFDYATVAGAGERLSVVGNLPYHLTSPILFSLLDQVDQVSRATFLVQREVAERLAAEPGQKDWGILSVFLQREAEVSIERIVPPGAFFPPPKIHSAVILALFRPPAPGCQVLDAARFRKLVKGGFAQRRKTLRNALEASRVAPAGPLRAALRAAGIDGGRRGETLTVAEWASLERALGPVAAGPTGAAADLAVADPDDSE
jgi:16S rRNA (adenine1518-N6/adenine1519-N6)-dimethyltransferase